MPISTIAAIVAAALLAALILWQIGDRRWEGTAPVVAITVLGFAAVLAVVQRLRSRVSLRLAPMPGPAAILNGLRRDHAHMLGGSVWLLAATLVVSLGSFIFWLLVAQRAPAEDVGRATALFSASMFICYLTSLGLPIAVSRYASDRTQGSATLFAWSLLLTIGVVARGCGRLRRARSGLDPGGSRHLAPRFRLARGVPAGRGPVDLGARRRAADGAAALVPRLLEVLA